MTERVSRYFRTSDVSPDTFVFPLPATWWSRRYEYAWAASFAEKDHCVLDTACGISHPLKFYLADHCSGTYACDLDSRILDDGAVMRDVGADFGNAAISTAAYLALMKIKRDRADITELPYTDKMFDRVFCISVLEHLPRTDMARALKQFKRVLKPDGLIVATFDVPTVDVRELARAVKDCGLDFAGEVQLDRPADAVHTEMYGGLACFRALLRHAPEKAFAKGEKLPTVTAVLNGFRRPRNLNEQVVALQAQTIPPAEILVWQNATDSIDVEQNTAVANHAKVARCNANFGVWARFAYALNAKSEYVCVFDDDTIPGSMWFENCVTSMANREALYGTIGLLYVNPPPADSAECSYFAGMTKIGWYPAGSCDNTTTLVDFVGHAWFFKREWLSAFWRELHPEVSLCGEDMHFSFMLQKYLGIPTAVPPHPVENKKLWGSIKGEIGRDENSLWEKNPTDAIAQSPFRDSMNTFFVEQRRRGWRLIND
jgi:SAM-dependent methyltransferase